MIEDFKIDAALGLIKMPEAKAKPNPLEQKESEDSNDLYSGSRTRKKSLMERKNLSGGDSEEGSVEESS